MDHQTAILFLKKQIQIPRKRINISVTLVSESYVILYGEKNVICNSSIKICFKKKELN